MNLKQKIKALPEEPGIYKFYNSQGDLIYVGKSVSLKKRVTSYFVNKDLGPKTNTLVKNIADIEHIKVFSEFEALLLEADLIRVNKPFYNIQAKDDKSPVYIAITKDKIPLVLLTRKTNISTIKKAFVKGPFPSARTTKEILKNIRRIFPYCHHKNPKKPCLFVYLGLCPYPYKDQKSQLAYPKNINRIKKLLKGQTKTLTRELSKEMQNLSSLEKFEEAQEIKYQIEKLKYITTTYHTPREFLERPTLVDDLSSARLIDLKNKLSLAKLPRRIECYDISNLGGKFATGSMVVFTNGKMDKSQYRRFKIKFKTTPDDFEMLREVIARRFKNSWPVADLMVIDGGKGQLSSAVEIAQKYNKSVKIVSLAKKIEEIFVPGQGESIKLPNESPARQLVQALRDEAHHFAITYHRLLRSKQFLK